MEEPWCAVLRAIVEGTRAWSSPAEIALQSELAIEEVCIHLSELDAGGWVEKWDEAWTLTPFAAEYLGVRLYEFGLAERVRWSAVPPATKRPSRAKRRETEDHADALHEVVDPGPSVEEMVEWKDEVEKWWPKAPFDVDRLPRPTIFLMGCAIVWTEKPATIAGKPRSKRTPPPHHCSACKNSPLKPGVICGRCLRWNLDGVVATRRRAAHVAKRNAG